MTERGMTEAAARAYRLNYYWNERLECYEVWRDGEMTKRAWLPRRDDGDSFRLAAALRISVEHNRPNDSYGWVIASVDDGEVRSCYQENVPDESQRADRMRLAILRCAAAQAPKEQA
ncbi:MAG: hypothetical protein E2581_13625 [Pseudomonas sp.]|uniref:hypothetical protein n=1 Tax=Pseudomonas sp. TaxID=306 RepID=UPI001D7ECFE5|nr:hypothetical protein [Pseudomonas sp.]MPS99524.1 hypothetical protein [Pseudomonas sp.]